MRAVIYTGGGGPEVISIGEVPKPEVRPGHIRVRVHAAGLNRADLIQRRGHYAAPPGWPADIPGLEIARREHGEGVVIYMKPQHWLSADLGSV